MQQAIVDQLLALNQAFYQQHARSFSETRQPPWPGFARLAQAIAPCGHLLDVGCGNGRLGRFLLEQHAIEQYTGVDFSAELLDVARLMVPQGSFAQRNLLGKRALAGFGRFDAIALLAVLHHIPGHANRRQLLVDLRDHLHAGGTLVMANFQFLSDARLRRKLLDWSSVGLDRAAVEPGDYLLDWQRDGDGVRYLNLIDAAATERLADEAGWQIVEQFYSDGRNQALNLYTVMR